MTNYLNINNNINGYLINGEDRDVSSLTVPTDRTFREAWSFNEAVVEIDMTAAKVIHKDSLRAERAPRLAELDVAYMKALEAGSGADAVAASKTTLRNITADSRINDASTPDALKALNLETLLGE